MLKHQPTPTMLPEVLERMNRVLGPATEFIPLHVPEFLGKERDYVLDCIDTGWVSSVGSYVDRFETELAAACGAARAVVVVNGTAALHLAMIVAGVKPNDEVIIPALTFAATANAVHHLGAVPHFVDSCETTLGLDPSALAAHLRQVAVTRPEGLVNTATGRRISCVVPMHVFGHAIDMDALNAVAAEFGLVVVEDAAESLGSQYKGRPCGSLSKISALSFNGNKIITTGGGGAILTDDPELGRHAKHLSTTAKVPHRWAYAHDEVGYNYRMPNLNAALGVAQLAQLDTRLAQKRVLAARYIAGFEGLSCGAIFREPENSHSNYWLNTLILAPGVEIADRDTLLDGLNDAGYMARPIWSLLHHAPYNAACPRAPLPVAEQLERRIINLPSSAMLADRA